MPEILGMKRFDFKVYKDNRGTFTRLFEPSFLQDVIPDVPIVNINRSVNPLVNTLRGFHYSTDPKIENKIFVCLQGSIHNVTIDVRSESASKNTVAINTLSSEDNQALLVPGGCANAWMTLEANTVVLYFVTAEYNPKFEKGIKYDDPFFGIEWPHEPSLVSEKDLSWSPYSEV